MGSLVDTKRSLSVHVMRPSSGLLPVRWIWATEIPCWMPASIAISQLAICPEKTIIRRPAATARSTCSKPRVSTRPPGWKTRIFAKCGYSAATRPRLSHIPAAMRAISASESSGKARLMLCQACLETPRKGPIRRASPPPRAEAQSRGRDLNPPNRNAAPQASRRWANRGVLERLGAGVLALGINCANQVGIHFRRHTPSKSPCPPLRVALVRSPTRLRSRNCRKDSRCPQFRAAAVRQAAPFASQWYPRERAQASRQWLAQRSLPSGELIFLDDALVTVDLTFNAVLE